MLLYIIPAFLIHDASFLQGSCRTLDLSSITPTWSGSWAQYTIHLESFSWSKDWQDSAVTFDGCSGSVSSWDVNQLEFKNTKNYEQWLCIDHLQYW